LPSDWRLRTPCATLCALRRVFGALPRRTRRSDLIVYTWVVISLLIMLNLHIKLRLQLDMITRLARAVAIDRAKDMLGRKAEAPPIELQAKK
jgi:hypothetical protein